jgi:osmotically-inducible protein OsmY
MRLNFSLCLVLLLSLAAPVALAQADPAASRSDAEITRDANAALRSAARKLEGSAILLESRQGEVTLRGSVPTPRVRDRAAKVVKDVPGVVAVHVLLDIGSEAGPGVTTGAPSPRSAGPRVALGPERTLPFTPIPAPPAPLVDVAMPDLVQADTTDDAEIRRAVLEALLDLDPQENATVVVSVKNGVVWLNGVVPTWEGNDARLHAARSVPGVRTIVNELQVGQEVR